MRPVVLVLFGCAALLAASTADARTAGGDLLWQDQFGVVEMAASDGRVAAVGTVPNPDGSRTSVVRVYDADAGTLLWQAAVAAHSVVLDENRVVVAGVGFIRAYDAKKGTLAWHDRPPFAVTQLYRDEDTTLATAVTADGNAIRVRTYNTRRGSVLVRDQTLRDDTLPFWGPTTFSAGRMFVATSVQTDFPEPFTTPCQMRAYSIATGERLWVTTQPFLFPNTWDCGPIAVTADRKRVVLAGIGSFFSDFMAQGYDATTGEFLWQHLMILGTGGVDAALAVDIERGIAFVGGWTISTLPGARSFDQDFVIRALDADTGAVRWEGRSRGPECPPPGGCVAHAKLVVADSGMVYGAGFVGENGVSQPGTGFLRGYDSKSGRLRWQQDVDVEAIAATRGTVLVLTPGASADDVILRAYDGK